MIMRLKQTRVSGWVSRKPPPKSGSRRRASSHTTRWDPGIPARVDEKTGKARLSRSTWSVKTLGVNHFPARVWRHSEAEIGKRKSRLHTKANGPDPVFYFRVPVRAIGATWIRSSRIRMARFLRRVAALSSTEAAKAHESLLAAPHLLASGVPLPTVSARLGHSYDPGNLFAHDPRPRRRGGGRPIHHRPDFNSLLRE